MKFKFLPVSLLLFASWSFLASTKVDPNNPPTAKTGAPGETTCSTSSGCHTGGSFTGTVTMSGVPDTVVANQTYTITLTNASDAVRAGFQMTCLDGANAMSGTFTAGSGVSIGSGAAGKKYPRQSSPKTLSGGSTSWTFTWKAPLTASGNKSTFYFVSLCANGNGQKTGDNALQSTKTVVLKSTTAANEPGLNAALNFYPTLVLNNTLHIELLEATSGQITVFDMKGQRLMQQQLMVVNELNLQNLAKGVYTAVIEAEGKTATKKFVVE